MPDAPLSTHHTTTVPGAVDVAFRRFVDEFGLWWPQEYTWSGNELGSIGLDPTPGGRCTERSADGFTIDFGRVLAIERPHRFTFAWCIGPDRVPVPDVNRAGTVTVAFSEATRDETTVDLEYTGIERHGDAAAGYRDAMASEHGWPYVLRVYRASFDE